MKLAPLLEPLRREYRAHRMTRFALWVGAYGIALWGVARAKGGVPGKLWVLFWLASIPTIFYYFFRLVGLFRQRLLWRLRWRLRIAYLFIAVVPIALILLLAGLGAFIINGQFAAFLVAMRIRDHFDELRELNRAVAHEAHQNRASSPQLLLDHLTGFFVTELSQHASSYPDLQVGIRVDHLERAFFLDGKAIAHAVKVPTWLTEEEFAGIVMEGGQITLRAVNSAQTALGELVVILSEPLTPEFLDLMGAGIGPVGVIVPQVEQFAGTAQSLEPGFRLRTTEGKYIQTVTIRSKSVETPPPVNRLDFIVVGGSSLDPVIWGGEKDQHLPVPVLLYASSRILTLNRQLFATLGEYSGAYVSAFLGVATLFLLLELFALVIGVQLTRSMTTTVDKLYDATERVKAGDLSHRINLPARDQLSALGEAFDSMTASVERLLRESKETSRLQSEIEIAREVQRQLFPRAAPQVPGLELYGVCKPASAVSGDYYDFLGLGGNRVALALGDVSGKGISAALLMAGLRSALHAQFYDGLSPQASADLAFPSAAEVVARLNRHVFEASAAEKYATFFFAVYDARTRKLTYTNAGHWPPALFRRDAILKLQTGGTAVGLFSPMTYEEAEVQLEPGDLLLAFTDGIVEAENSYGEEFGETRVLKLVQRALGSPAESIFGPNQLLAAVLVEEIYRSVTEWTGSLELQDDMTVLVARALA